MYLPAAPENDKGRNERKNVSISLGLEGCVCVCVGGGGFWFATMDDGATFRKSFGVFVGGCGFALFFIN